MTYNTKRHCPRFLLRQKNPESISLIYWLWCQTIFLYVDQMKACSYCSKSFNTEASGRARSSKCGGRKRQGRPKTNLFFPCLPLVPHSLCLQGQKRCFHSTSQESGLLSEEYLSFTGNQFSKASSQHTATQGVPQRNELVNAGGHWPVPLLWFLF